MIHSIYLFFLFFFARIWDAEPKPDIPSALRLVVAFLALRSLELGDHYELRLAVVHHVEVNLCPFGDGAVVVDSDVFASLIALDEDGRSEVS